MAVNEYDIRWIVSTRFDSATYRAGDVSSSLATGDRSSDACANCMDLIERNIQVSWRHRVIFTDHVFNPSNAILKEMLAGDGAPLPRKTLLILDESLAKAQPDLVAAISVYFDAHKKL